MDPDRERQSGVIVPQTYKEYYRKNTLFGNDYEHVMLLHTIEEVDSTDGETVAGIKMASTLKRIPVAYLILGMHPGVTDATVQLYHRVVLFRSRLGMKPRQSDNQVFYFCGDLLDGVITIVEVDKDIFNATQDRNIRVATNVFMGEVFEADVRVRMVGSFDNDNDRTGMIRMLITVYERPLFVEYLLLRDLAQRKAYQQLSEIVRNDQKQ